MSVAWCRQLNASQLSGALAEWCQLGRAWWCMVVETAASLPGQLETWGLLLGAGITAENVSLEYDVSREAEDSLAAASHAKAARAQAEGKFKEEIVPVETVKKDPVTGRGFGVSGVEAGPSHRCSER